MIKINGNKIIINKFPNGESKFVLENFQLDDGKPVLNLEFKYEGDESLLHLMFIKKHLDSLRDRRQIRLHLFYVPYSRMDRTNGEELFTLKYFSEFINNMNFDKVYVYEPHSDVSPALLDRSEVVFPTRKLFDKLIEKEKLHPIICFPDYGAFKRYTYEFLGFEQINATKSRNFQTGEIEKFEIKTSIKIKGQDIIIVDDLCSRGGTFSVCADILKEMGANRIYLVVTHLEDGFLEGNLVEKNGNEYTSTKLEKIYTTDSIYTLKDKVKVNGLVVESINIK